MPFCPGGPDAHTQQQPDTNKIHSVKGCAFNPTYLHLRHFVLVKWMFGQIGRNSGAAGGVAWPALRLGIASPHESERSIVGAASRPHESNRSIVGERTRATALSWAHRGRPHESDRSIVGAPGGRVGESARPCANARKPQRQGGSHAWSLQGAGCLG